MIRKRLRTTSGCLSCRARRKKCDETKPVCKSCVRLGKRCFYSDPTSDQTSFHHQGSFDMPVLTEQFLSSIPDTEPTTVTRTADHSVWWQDVTPDEDNMVGLFNADTRHGLASAVSNLESAIISGVWRGWASLLPKFDVPQRVVDLDKHLRSAGHGIIARTVFMYYNCLIDEYIMTKAKSPLSESLPIWSIVSSVDSTVNDPSSGSVDRFNPPAPEQMITMYIPWPAARTRVQRESFKYCNDRFFRQLWKSTRFIWPFTTADAIYVDDHVGNWYFSAELLLRATNIRSFPVTKDFLDTYPAFRGEVPQFEPSPTWYRPEEQRRWELVYWAKLREERSTSKKRAFHQI